MSAKHSLSSVSDSFLIPDPFDLSHDPKNDFLTLSGIFKPQVSTEPGSIRNLKRQHPAVTWPRVRDVAQSPWVLEKSGS